MAANFKTVYQTLSGQYQQLRELADRTLREATQVAEAMDDIEHGEIPALRTRLSMTTDRGKWCEIDFADTGVTFKDAKTSSDPGAEYSIAVYNNGVAVLNSGNYESALPGIETSVSELIDQVCDAVGATQLYATATNLVLNGSFSVEGFKAQVQPILEELGDRASEAYITILSVLREDGIVSAASQLIKSVFNQLHGATINADERSIDWATSEYDVRTIVGVTWEWSAAITAVSQLLLLIGNATVRIVGAILYGASIAVSKVIDAVQNVRDVEWWNESAAWTHYAQPVYQGVVSEGMLENLLSAKQIQSIKEERISMFSFGSFVLAIWYANPSAISTSEFNCELFLNAAVDPGYIHYCVHEIIPNMSWTGSNYETVNEGAVHSIFGAEGQDASAGFKTYAQYYLSDPSSDKGYMTDPTILASKDILWSLWDQLSLFAALYLSTSTSDLDTSLSGVTVPWVYNSVRGWLWSEDRATLWDSKSFDDKMKILAATFDKNRRNGIDGAGWPVLGWEFLVEVIKDVVESAKSKDSGWTTYKGFVFINTINKMNAACRVMRANNHPETVLFSDLPVVTDIGAKGNPLLLPPEYSDRAKFNTFLLGGAMIALTVAATIGFIKAKITSRQRLAQRQAKDNALLLRYQQTGDYSDFDKYWKSQRRTRTFARRWGLLSQLTKAPATVTTLSDDISCLSQSVSAMMGASSPSVSNGATSDQGFGILPQILKAITG